MKVMSKQKLKTSMIIISLQLLILPLIFTFSNCSQSDHAGSENLKSLEFGNCSLEDSRMLFAYTYSQFLQKKCASCHVPGKPGKGAFASSDLNVSFGAFETVGYKRIGSFAIDSNHNSPYSGPQNKPEIDEDRALWILGQKELRACDGDVAKEFVDDIWIKQRTYSVSRSIHADPESNASTKIQWDLNRDMLVDQDKFPWPVLPGAIFEIEVTVEFKGNTPNYSLLRPKIIYPNIDNSAVDIHIDSLRFKLNGVDILNETTFHYVSADARKNETTYLSAGAMVAIGELRLSDVISFSIGNIEAIVMPQPPPRVSVQFANVTRTVTEGSGGLFTTVQIPLKLNQPVDNFATATVSLNNSAVSTAGVPAAKRPCCSNISRDDGQSVLVKNFDRDYVVPGYNFESATVQMQVQFFPNTVDANLEIQIFNDDRNESNESIELDLVSLELGDDLGTIGTQPKYSLIITDNGDSAPAIGEITFSQLMQPSGVFATYCVKCHHATSRDVLYRQFDMTGYVDFKASAKPLVSTGNPNNSLIYGRVMGEFPVGSGKYIDPMPQGGGLVNDTKATNQIYNWIYNGAKNN